MYLARAQTSQFAGTPHGKENSEAAATPLTNPLKSPSVGAPLGERRINDTNATPKHDTSKSPLEKECRIGASEHTQAVECCIGDSEHTQAADVELPSKPISFGPGLTLEKLKPMALQEKETEIYSKPLPTTEKIKNGSSGQSCVCICNAFMMLEMKLGEIQLVKPLTGCTFDSNSTKVRNHRNSACCTAVRSCDLSYQCAETAEAGTAVRFCLSNLGEPAKHPNPNPNPNPLTWCRLERASAELHQYKVDAAMLQGGLQMAACARGGASAQ